MDRKTLQERAVKRGLATWRPLDPIELAVNELADQEATLNLLGQDSIRQGMVAADEAAYFQDSLRDRLLDLDMLALEQDQELARKRIHAERQALALRIAGEVLLLEAKKYDVQVQDVIMAAKEYAAEIDRESIELQKQRALMDIKKEEAHLEEVQSRILLELVERRNQEIELARAKVEVARANVRALLADIAAEEAEIRVIRAELEVAEAEADKAGLMADVAQILADIVVRGLAKIKLAVETAELEASFGFITQRLKDLLAIASAKLSTEELKLAYEKLINAQVALYEEAQKDSIDLERLRMAMAERLQAYQQWQQTLADDAVIALKKIEQFKKDSLTKQKHRTDVALSAARAAADIAVSNARANTRVFQIRSETQREFLQKIRKA